MKVEAGIDRAQQSFADSGALPTTGLQTAWRGLRVCSNIGVRK
jgi:hypothetical protein